MLKTIQAIAVLAVAAVTLQGAPFYAHGPREEINLAGDGWREGISDSLEMTVFPPNLDWKAAAVPGGRPKLTSSDHQWMYCNVKPEKYVNADGTFKVKEKLSAWYRRSVEIPVGLLKEHRVHLTLGGASYRSAVFVNGRLAGESIFATLPLDFDITEFLKAGPNELAIGVTTREGLIDPKHRVYIAPSNGTTPGIRGPIRLEFRPQVAVGDVFVKTSVQGKSIDFQTTLVNRDPKARQVSPRIKVRSARDPKQVVGEFTGEPVQLAPGTEQVVNLKRNWVAPILWTFDHPELYIAEVSLFDGDALVDTYQQTFGFREFTAKGKDLLLNGRRIVLLRNSSLNALKTLETHPDEISITQKPASINSIRQHLGACNTDLIHRANQQGIMVVPESAYSWVHIFPHAPEKVKIWLPNVLEYYKRWARHLRNEPSVVIYSLTNETYWERTLPEEMAVAKQIVEVMRREDPTRLLQADGDNYWGGLLDIINIHYPEGAAGTLRLTYPNASITVPNDIHWLSDTVGGDQAWRAEFTWDRPLVLGEFGGGADALSQSSFGGDDVYNWPKWRKNTAVGRDPGASDKHRASPMIATMRKMISHYRHMGVAGLNPWGGDLDEMIKPMVIDSYDFHPNVEAGGIFKRKLVAFNDESRPIHKIKTYLTIDGRIVWDKEIKLYLAPGKKWSGEVEIPIPEFDHPAKAEFMARLIWRRGNRLDIEMDRHVETIHIVPAVDLSKLNSRIVLIDPADTLKTLLNDLNLTGLARVANNTIPEDKRLLLIGRDAFKDDMATMLDSFVEKGGVVLMMPQKDWKPYRVELPERDPRHAATQAWPRHPDHPVFKGMEAGQFSFWRDDNVISYETFKKPIQGPFATLLDCGGRYGLIWSPLVEVPLGQGAFLMTTLELTKPDPGARQLFANLIDYGCERKTQPTVSLNLMAGQNGTLVDALKLTGVKISEGLGSSGPVLIDATADIQVAELQKALDQGRTLWLHGFTPETLPNVAALLPQDAKLAAMTKDDVETVTLANDPLTRGIANFDLLWHIPASWQGPKSVVAKTADWKLDTNLFVKSAKPLTTPALLVKLDKGEGRVLFDTLLWEKGIGKVTDKALRIASTLLNNLGCGFEFEAAKAYQHSFVDLAKAANMGYLDTAADDGVGGWTDQGENDMRFFLINHSGRMGGREDGAEVPIPPFPTQVDFNGVSYQLVAPKANGGKAVLSFGSAEHAPKLMRKTGPISVNRKADKLWFLHTMAWAGAAKPAATVAEYTVAYTDGTTATIPVRRDVDAGDWHNPAEYPNASVAWNGRNLISDSVGLHASSWDNPHPEKTIESLSIKAGLNGAQYVLLAITCGKLVKEGELPLAAQFDFETTPLLDDFYFKTQAKPVQSEKGLRFAHGQSLTFAAQKAGLTALLKHPFSIQFDITATDKPDGYCAGLIEPGAFRITLNKYSMKVVVETFNAEGKRVQIQSSQPVELNRRVSFEYKSDGKKGILLRDGKVDSIGDAVLPKHDIRQVRFGKAGGKDYNFNGFLHRVVFKGTKDGTE
jgi:beta-galactosidase